MAAKAAMAVFASQGQAAQSGQGFVAGRAGGFSAGGARQDEQAVFHCVWFLYKSAVVLGGGAACLPCLGARPAFQAWLAGLSPASRHN